MRPAGLQDLRVFWKPLATLNKNAGSTLMQVWLCWASAAPSPSFLQPKYICILCHGLHNQYLCIEQAVLYKKNAGQVLPKHAA